MPFGYERHSNKTIMEEDGKYGPCYLFKQQIAVSFNSFFSKTSVTSEDQVERTNKCGQGILWFVLYFQPNFSARCVYASNVCSECILQRAILVGYQPLA